MEASAGDEKGRTLLIVEGDPHVRELQATFLCEAGFSVEFADDGATALERVRQRRPDLLITEVLVPRLDGLALCRQLKNDSSLRTLPVLVLSMLAVTDRARDACADGYLRKPFTRELLVETVHTLLVRSDTTPLEEGA